MDMGREGAQMEGLVRADCNQHVVRDDGRVEELEDAMLGGLDCGDIAGQTGERGAEFLTGLAERPPQFCIGLSVLAA